MLFNPSPSHFASHHRKIDPDSVADKLGKLMTETLKELGIEYRERVFTPYMTLYAFLSQVFADDGSCSRAVIEVATILKSQGKKACSTGTGAYCTAKKRLPLELFKTLVRRLGQDLNQQAKEVWAHGRVLVVDGSGFSMPDTKSNAKKFIRHGENTHGKANKKSGVAFPIGRIVALFSLATGAVVDMTVSTWKGKGTGEISLLYGIWSRLKAGDTLLGDSLFSAYYVVAKAVADRVYIVTELKKTSQWRINPKLDDQIIEIERPRWRDQSCSISLPEHEALPEKIEVRVIKITCAPKGFRPKTKFILTTHTDSKKVPKADLADLYRKRWQVELNLRSIKTVLGMDVVRSTSEEMVIKEVWVHMLAYNLVRETMCAVAATKRCLTSEVSFRATQQIMSVWRLVNAVRGKRLHQSEMIEILMTQSLVGQRPDRYEPRAIKRRQKSYRLLIHSRDVAKTMLHKKSKK